MKNSFTFEDNPVSSLSSVVVSESGANQVTELQKDLHSRVPCLVHVVPEKLNSLIERNLQRTKLTTTIEVSSTANQGQKGDTRGY